MTHTQWLEKVRHDLVKYLEMMPRSLDWKNLDEEDVEVLYESVFETRADARGVRCAQEIWKDWRDCAPGDLVDSGLVAEVDACMATLGTIAAPLASGVSTVDDPEALRAAIFAVGDLLRSVGG